MRSLSFLAFLPLGWALTCSPAIAGESRATTKPAPARATAAQPAKGSVLLHGVRWHHNLADARKLAAATKTRKARPVLWLRMLGDLKAKT